MATISNILQNPSSYSGYQSLLKKKPATSSVPQTPTQSLGTFNSSNSSLVPTAVKKTATPASSVAAPVSDRNSQLESIKQQALAIQSQLSSQQNSQIRDVPSPNKGLLSTKDVNPALSFSGLVQTLADRAQTPTKEMDKVLKSQLALSKDLSEFRNEAATAPERIYGAGGGAKVVQGRLQGVQLANAAKEQAMATQLGELRDVYGNLLTGQGQAITGLTSAAGLAQPQLGAVGQVPFNPLDSSQSSILGSQGGGIQQAGGLLGELEAAKQRALTGGTAQTNTFAGIYGDAQSQAAQISQQRNAINQVGNEVVNLLQNNPTMNQFALQYGNKKINQLSTQLSDPRYAALNTYIQTLQARIGTALQAGEIPTAATQNAASIANGNLTLNALAATLQAVDKELGAFAQTQQDLANYAQGQFQGGNSGAGSSGGTEKIGNYTYKIVDGKYVLVQ